MSEKIYHFITGLPRSGSTLISSILQQNPKFHNVKKKVEYTPRNTILPPDILQKYNNIEVWRF